MPNFHPPLTAFPVVLISLVVVFEIWFVWRASPAVSFASRVLIVLSAVAVGAAFYSGYQASEMANQQFVVSDQAIAAHQATGRLLLFAIIPCAALRLFWEQAVFYRRVIRGVYYLLLVVCLGLVVVTGYRGGELVFRHGAGVRVDR